MAMSEIKLQDVTKRFGGTIALNRISSIFPRRKITVVLGPSGSGKSTLLRIISGLERPDEGKVLIDGELVNELEPYERGVSMIFQYPALFPHLKVYDNISFGLEPLGLSGEEIDERVIETAELLEINELLDRYPSMLSGGEMQRVSLARALVIRPKILLLDEPLGHLDVNLRTKLRRELVEIQRKLSITFIYVTHDQDEALEIADHLIILNEGIIVDMGNPIDVYLHPSTLESARFLGHNVVRIGDQLMSFPPDAIELDVEEYEGEVKAVYPARGRSVIALKWVGNVIYGYSSFDYSLNLSEGQIIRFSIRRELIKNWEREGS